MFIPYMNNSPYQGVVWLLREALKLNRNRLSTLSLKDSYELRDASERKSVSLRINDVQQFSPNALRTDNYFFA